MENIPLWHERDLSNSAAERIIIPGSTILVHYMTRKLAAVLSGLVVNPERMKENLAASGGVFFSQALLLALVKTGMSRDDGYRLVQRLAFRSRETETPFPELAKQDPTVRQRLDGRTLGRVFSLNRLIRHVDAVYRRVGLVLKKK